MALHIVLDQSKWVVFCGNTELPSGRRLRFSVLVPKTLQNSKEKLFWPFWRFWFSILALPLLEPLHRSTYRSAPSTEHSHNNQLILFASLATGITIQTKLNVLSSFACFDSTFESVTRTTQSCSKETKCNQLSSCWTPPARRHRLRGRGFPFFYF